jgi:type I restriction enzyme S subunit
MKNGWPTKRLGDVCEIIMGQSPDGDTYNTTGEGVPLINGPVEFSPEAFGKTIRSKFTTQPTKFCKEGDLILCVRGSTTGRMNIAGFDACVGRGVAAIRAKQYQPWINHFISSKRDEIHGRGTGATFPNVSGATVAGFELVVPPLVEQQRIVGILDQAFEGIVTAKSNAEKNLQNARALFQSHLHSVFTQRGNGWVEKPLETVASILNGYAFKSTDFSPKEGVKCIKITNVGVKEFVSASDNYLPDTFAAECGAVSVKQGSIVLALTRTIIAGGLKVAVVPDEYDGALLNQRVASIITNDNYLNAACLFSYLSTQTVVDYVKERVNTLMQPNLSITDLRSMPIPVPPRQEQDKIAEQLDGLRAETQRLANIYERKLAALEALKKSLLHQAFTGQL